MNVDRTLRFAAIALAADVGHLLGDYGTQTNKMACEKAHPDYNITEDVGYWQTWVQNQAHCVTYHAALAATVAAVAASLGIRIRPSRAIAALGLSWASHAVIDRRWPVKWAMKVTGSKDWYPAGAPHVDQMLHRLFLLAAAAIASGE